MGCPDLQDPRRFHGSEPLRAIITHRFLFFLFVFIFFFLLFLFFLQKSARRLHLTFPDVLSRRRKEEKLGFKRATAKGKKESTIFGI